MPFKIHREFEPAGDQPKAIEALVKGVKKGLKHQTLFGVTGSGKSVTADTQIFIRQNGKVFSSTMSEFADPFLEVYKKNIILQDDTEILNNILDLETYSFNPTTGISEWKRISQITRHRSPSKIWEIEASCGRSVQVTGDHNMYIVRNQKLNLVKSEYIKKGDFIPVPRSLEPIKEKILEINITSDLLKSGRKYYFKLCETVFPSFKKILSYQKYYHATECGKGVLLNDNVFISGKYNPITVFAKGGKEIQTIQCISDRFLRFLGYYIAEGHATDRYIVLSSADKEIVDDIREEVISRGMSFAHRKDTYDYQLSSVAWRDILYTWCGGNAYTKHLPPFWVNLSNMQLAELLKAYFSGDGGVDTGSISATTASKKLGSELLYALLRFGIIARLKHRMVKIPNIDRRSHSWRVYIYGKDQITLFQKYIGFSLERKNKNLYTVLAPSANTNVDIVPIDGTLLKKMRTTLGLFQTDIAKECGIVRSHVSLLEDGHRKPSRILLAKLVKFFDKRIQQNSQDIQILDQWKMLLNLFWTPIQKIKKIDGGKYVYDFAIEKNETFLAGVGGVFVHNTFTAANVIQEIQKPTLVIAHNKTLAAQLAQEYKEFFPENAVHYFVSYYDYYQPEAYMPVTDTYIEKEAMINEEIDRLRHASTQALLTRRDVIIVASVSCIYGLGSPVEYEKVNLKIAEGEEISRTEFIHKLIAIHFERTTADLEPGMFRAIGNMLEIMPISEKVIYRLEILDGRIKQILKIDAITREIIEPVTVFFLFPAKHFISTKEQSEQAFKTIKAELDERLIELEGEGKLLEVERLKRRTTYDLALIREMGYCTGIENYSRHFSGKLPGEAPDTLLSYFPHSVDSTGKIIPEFLTIIDESHVTVPQIGGMYGGDASRKQALVEYGFRLPSAKDNRPLKFEEFEKRVGQTIYTSATPGDYEREHSEQVVEQVIRPTGLIDPVVEVKPIVENGSYKGQIFDFITEAQKAIKAGGRVIATTLTKKMAEDLSEYLKEKDIKAEYLHSDIKTIQRIEILTEFRRGKFDVIVGVNLLREGLDLPEVTLIGILDADKAGFLRSETSLIQIIGRAARNVLGRVILYADVMTGAMKYAIDETARRRTVQMEYNTKHGITPKTIIKKIQDITDQMKSEHDKTVGALIEMDKKMFGKDPTKLIEQKEKQMESAVKVLDFETAAILRDEVAELIKMNTPKKEKKVKNPRNAGDALA